MPAKAPSLSAFVKYEAPQNYSRDDVIVVSGQNLAIGTVVGRITASGKVTAWTTGAADGSQNAIGVLTAAVNATAGDAPGVIIARHAEIVTAPHLVFAGAPTDPQKATAMAAMRALGIVSRVTV